MPCLPPSRPVAAPFAAQAQTTISEDFSKATTTNSWWYFNGACLTASTHTGQEPTVSGGVGTGGQIPGCTTIATSYYNKTAGEHLVGGQTLTNTPDPPDPAGQGALRFTNGYPYGYTRERRHRLRDALSHRPGRRPLRSRP